MLLKIDFCSKNCSNSTNQVEFFAPLNVDLKRSCPFPSTNLLALSPYVLIHHDERISPTPKEPLNFAYRHVLERSIGMPMFSRVVSILETNGAPMRLVTIHILASRVIEWYTEHFCSTSVCRASRYTRRAFIFSITNGCI